MWVQRLFTFLRVFLGSALHDGAMTSSPLEMFEQPSLPGFGPPPGFQRLDPVREPNGGVKGYLLFLGIFPDPQHAERMARLAQELRSRHGLDGEPVLASRLHVTLHALMRFSPSQPVPQLIVDAARAAACSVTCPPIPIVFDRAMSFAGSRRSTPFVLRSDVASDEAIGRLRQSLRPALRRVGLRAHPSATPHMTLLYDHRRVAEHVIDPVHWVATRYALILSHVGAGHHQWIDQWPLRGAA